MISTFHRQSNNPKKKVAKFGFGLCPSMVERVCKKKLDRPWEIIFMDSLSEGVANTSLQLR